jgi:N-methylhydantoinase A
MLPGNEDKYKLDVAFQSLLDQGRDELLSEGIQGNKIHFDPTLDMRYRGQSFELNIPFRNDFLSEFHQSHQAEYGYAHPGAEVEIVNIRLRAKGLTSPPEVPVFQDGDGDSSKALLSYRSVVVSHQNIEIPIYQGELLTPGDQIQGPAVVLRKDTTIYLPHATSAIVDRFLNQVIGFKD